MFYKIWFTIQLAIFYAFYLYKLISLNAKSIKTNQVGIGNKETKVKLTEKMMSLTNVLVIICMLASIIQGKNRPVGIFMISIFIGFLGIFFFASATITMKNNWRVGIPEEKTELVCNGIYKYSRNPAFVGFDLLYLSINIMYFNIFLLLSSLLAAYFLHLQILLEEKHMLKMFGDKYQEYMNHTHRYL